MTNRLLVEASLLSYDAYFDTPDYTDTRGLLPSPAINAPARGWAPLSLPGLEVPGVDQAVLEPFATGTPFGFTTLGSAAHFYEGTLEGRKTVVLAYRSTDEGALELAFQSAPLPPNPFGAAYGWDLYQFAHEEASAAALDYAADPANGVEQVLITGHSLGGIIAELTAVRLLGEGEPYAELAPQTLVVTFGSPGSTASADNVNQVNVVHSDDVVAQRFELLSPFGDADIDRQGTDIVVERGETTLPRFQAGDHGALEDLLAALRDPALLREHQIDLYIDTAALLSAAEDVVPVVREAGDDPFRWLVFDLDRVIVGGGDQDVVAGDDLILGRREQPVLMGEEDRDVPLGGADGAGFRGDDILAAGAGVSALFGGRGDGAFRSGIGDRLAGFTSDDIPAVGEGVNALFGGDGAFRIGIGDTFAGFTADDILAAGPGVGALFGVRGDGAFRSGIGDTFAAGGSGAAVLRSADLLDFDDRAFAGAGDGLGPVAPGATAQLASVSLDDLMTAPDVD
jgi:hypothetical protein